ncbi:hypothetical protein ACTFIY_001774 [Dictyostelium cf. discoideum]
MTDYVEWRKQKNLDIEKVMEIFKTIDNPKFEDFEFLSTKDEVKVPTFEIIKTLVLGAIGCIPTYGAFISNAISCVFLEYTSKGNDTKNEFWKDFSVKIKELEIDNRVSDFLSEVFGIDTHLKKFLYAKLAFKTDPIGEAAYCLQEYNDVEDRIRDYLNKLMNNNDTRFKTVGIFGLMATIHLIILNEGIKYGSKWGMKEFYKNEITKCYNDSIPKYIEHCTTCYKEGVAKIKEIDYMDSAQKFSAYNDYRNFCATRVFDFINGWIGLDENKFPDSINLENVRYLWTGPFGIPVDNSKSVPNYIDYQEEPYFDPSFANINDNFMALEYDMVNLRVKSCEFNADSFWIYNHREILENGEGPIKGSMKAPFFNSKKVNFNISKAEATSIVVESDVQPRLINVKGTPEPEIHLGVSMGAFIVMVDGSFPTPTPRPFQVVGTSRVELEFENHKVARIGVHDTNKFKKFAQLAFTDGIIDSIFVGFLPLEITPKNYVFPKRAAVINVQKARFINDSKFAKDHVAPTIHSIKVENDSQTIFDIELLPNNTVRKYSFGIRYHCTQDSEIILFDGPEDGNYLPLEKCSTSGYNQYKIKLFPNKFITFEPNSNSTYVTIQAKSQTLYIESIILLPQQ